MGEDFVRALAGVVSAGSVLTGEACASYFTDWRGRYSGTALAVVFPADTQQVAGCVRLCAEHGIAIVPQGGNTSLCGASVPLSEFDHPQVVINLSRMNRIRAVDATNYTMTVEAGCKLAALYEAAEHADRLFPLGLTAIAPHCEIGGNLSTNAGGIGVLRYGSTRDLVLGLEVVLPDGRVWNGLRSLRKDNTGYDLKHLFIGAEGTLGIITAAVLKLYPRTRSAATACVAVRNPAAAVGLLAHLRATCGDKISGFELISRSCLDLVFKHIPDTHEPLAGKHDWTVLAKLADVLAVPLDGALHDALESFGGDVAEFGIASDEAQADRWWKLRRSIAEAQKAEGISIKHDVSVPVSRVAEFIARASAALRAAYPDIRIIAFGHMGDGNIHYNASMPDAWCNRTFIAQHERDVNRRVYGVVRELNGSISAEHGLGQLKRDEITEYKNDVEMELMRNIKRMLDPVGTMNPGKVL
ncbi:MAG TPA: FAD-binding oxidoreductase [Gallionella sp.]